MSCLARFRARLRVEEGWGLIELLAAMVVLAIAVGALLSVFSASVVALRRAGVRGTATVLAEKQMELYRKVAWDEIRLDSGQLATAPAPYTDARGTFGDDWFPAAGGDVVDGATGAGALATLDCGTTPPSECLPVQDIVGPDRHHYRIDTYIKEGATPEVRTVWVAVYELNADGTLKADSSGNVVRPLARAASSFSWYDYGTG
jgi:type II secretory pathway pseudopilin PulG